MKPSNDEKGLPLSLKIASAGLAGCTADLATFPLDTIKVWLQVRGEGGSKTTGIPGSAPKIRSRPIPGETAPVHASRTFAVPISKSSVSNPMRMIYSLPKGSLASNSSALNPALTLRPNSAATFTEMTLSEMYMLKKAALSPSPAATPNAIVDNRLSAAVKMRAHASQTFNELTLSELYMAKKKALSALSPAKSTKTAIETISTHVKQSGVRSLYSGLNAGLQRQIGFCSVRIGFYDNVKNFYVDLIPGAPDSKMIGQRILAGGTTGIMAVCLFQPTEVVKIRMQAERGRYKGTFQAYRSLYKAGGLPEAWKGIGANCARTAVVNICELVTYDMVKESILKHKLMTDNLPCHFASALISGFVTTVVASPIDVVKTRYMNSDRGSYKNPIQCAAKMLKSEGFTAFYKGFVPSYLRLGSWNLVMFISYEQYKRFFRDVAQSTPEFPSPHLGTAAPLLTPTEQLPEPTYPSYIEAMSHSQQDGPSS